MAHLIIFIIKQALIMSSELHSFMFINMFELLMITAPLSSIGLNIISIEYTKNLR